MYKPRAYKRNFTVYSVSSSSNDYQAKLFLFICGKAPGLWEISNGKHYKLLAVDSVDYF